MINIKDKTTAVESDGWIGSRARGDRGSGRVRALRDVLTCASGEDAPRQGKGSADRLGRGGEDERWCALVDRVGVSEG